MARTKHTDPAEIRARRRLTSPRAPRGDDDLRDARAASAALRDLGVPAPDVVSRDKDDWPLPRIKRTRPRPGFGHPLEPADIRAALRIAGPTCVYGIRGIELRNVEGSASGRLRLASLLVPGTILLFEQPTPPWRLPGPLDEAAAERMIGFGARVQIRPPATRVTWPGESLRDLMLFDGLFHEIGHHLIQQYEGKREVRKMRSSDHERRAEAFALSWRKDWPDAATT